MDKVLKFVIAAVVGGATLLVLDFDFSSEINNNHVNNSFFAPEKDKSLTEIEGLNGQSVKLNGTEHRASDTHEIKGLNGISIH